MLLEFFLFNGFALRDIILCFTDCYKLYKKKIQLINELHSVGLFKIDLLKTIQEISHVSKINQLWKVFIVLIYLY